MTQLHSAEEAIKVAVEAGYNNWKIGPNFTNEDVSEKLIRWGKLPEVLQDPAFWQALGKARGWPEWVYPYGYSDYPKHRHSQGDEYIKPPGNIDYVDKQNAWLYHALRYFETLLAGEDTKEFWSNLP